MRSSRFPTCILTFFSLLNAMNSTGQENEKNISTIKSIPLSSDIRVDTSELPFLNKQNFTNQLPKSVFNNLNEVALPKDIRVPQEIINRFKLPVDLKKPVFSFAETNLTTQVNNTASNTIVPETYQSSVASTNLTVWNVPFSFGYNSNSDWRNNADQLAFGTAKFDKEKFLDQIKEKIKKVANPEDLFREALNPLYAKRDEAINTMKNELTDVLKSSNHKLLQEVKDKINIENISQLGVDQFLNNILNENLTQISQKEKALAHLQSKARAQPELSDSIIVLSGEIETLNKSKEQIVSQVSSLKDKWFKNGVLETIGGFEKEKKLMINALMNDPAKISKIAGDKLKLPGLQKILLNAKSLNIGSSGIKQSALGLNDVLLKGISLEFLKGNRFFAPVLGTQPGIKNITDFSYSNFNELPNILTTAMRMGKGDIKEDFSHVSVSLFQQNNNQQFLPAGLQTKLPRNLVTSFSKRVSLGESHSLLTEISKSTMLYNPVSGGGGKGFKDVLNSDNIFGNMGGSLDYGGEFENIGVSEKLTVRYTGKEYNNLGNYSLVSGAKELSNDVKKYFLNRRLIVNIKAHYREYDFSVDDRKWRSFSYMTDLKWKMKKGEFIEVRYQPYFNRRINLDENYLSSKSYRIALRGNINRKLWKGFTYRNFIELASSKDNFYDLVRDRFNSNGFISFTSLQTLAVGERTLFVNITANHARQNTGYLFGNSSISLDGGATFNAARNISLSSSLVYNEVSKMYGQLAIRQSVSALVGKKIVFDGFLHAGKNLFEQQDLHIPAISGNLSISYNLK